MTNTPLALSPSSSRRFWLSFAAGLVGFLYAMVAGGYAFGGSYAVQLAGLILAPVALLAWLAWRLWRRPGGLPRTGLEEALGLGLLVLLASLAFSPDPRQGLWRVGSLAACALLFYFFLSLCDGLDAWGLLAGLAVAVGLILFEAVCETYFWYMNWFQSAGGLRLPPQQYRFAGLVSSSPTQAIANLLVFAVLWAFLRSRRRLVRLGAAVWLVLFALTFPFSSSRSGWVGFAAGLLAAAALWAWRTHPWQAVAHWPRTRQVLLGAGLAAALLAAGLLAMPFLRLFASNATHGGDPFGDSGRSIFWAGALKVWQASPWLGAGPGRFAYDYLSTLPGVPPGFWPVQAHNLFLNALSELGLAGLAALLLLLARLARWLFTRLRAAAPAAWPYLAGLCAGLVGLLAQQMFDDLTLWMAVMLPMVFVVAWAGGPQVAPLASYRRLPAAWLAAPTLALMALAAWQTWATQPLAGALADAQRGDWAQAAQGAAESARRDPAFLYYQVQSGLAWAMDWQQGRDPAALESARQAFGRALAIEPAPSWLWADLAVLDFIAGDRPAAFTHIQRALALHPTSAAYALNRAAFYEQAGEPATALEGYRQVLALAPEWATAPFWTTSPLRQAALGLGLGLPAPAGVPASAATPSSDQAAALSLAQERRYLDQGLVFTDDAFLANRKGFGTLLVPGFMRLNPDSGQYAAAQRQVEQFTRQGDCQAARALAETLQEATYGYAIDRPAAQIACP